MEQTPGEAGAVVEQRRACHDCRAAIARADAKRHIVEGECDRLRAELSVVVWQLYCCMATLRDLREGGKAVTHAV